MTFRQRLATFYKREIRDPVANAYTTLFPNTAQEPFVCTTKAQWLTEFAVFCSLVILVFFSSSWQISEGHIRNNQLQCNQPVTVGLALTFFVILVVQFIIFLIYSSRFKLVFPAEKLNFTYMKPRDISRCTFTNDVEDEVRYTRREMKYTITQLRNLVKKVEKEEKPLFSPTRFLLSEKGKSFLNEGCRRLKKLQLLDGHLVRIDDNHILRQGLLYLIVTVCSTASVASAYAESQTCSGRILIVNFMDKFSITLLTILAISAFAGLSEYAQLFSTFEEKFSLSDDECFLISLIAANTDDPFHGFAETEDSGYATISTIGTKHVFIPIHMSLFAYKLAKTKEREKKDRWYNKTLDSTDSKNDCVGNYYMH